MLKRGSILTPLFFHLLFVAAVYAAPLSSDPHRMYIIGGDDNFPPYEYVVEADTIKAYRGFNVDIMKAVALQMGIEFEFRPMTWSSALEALDNGHLDAIQGMKYDKDRAAKYNFVSYLTSSQAVFVLKDTMLVDLADLKGHKIAVQNGDIAYQRLKGGSEYILKIAPNQEEAFKLLLSGEVTAVIGNKLAGQYILHKNKQIEQVKMLVSNIDPSEYGVAVRRDNAELLAVMQTGIAEIKRNGTYDKIYKKWFGEPVEYPSIYYRERLSAALVSMAVLLFILAFMFYLSYILRREVNKQTGEIRRINRELVERNEYIRKENIYQEKILNSGYNGIVTMDCQGYIKFINRYAVKYLGCADIIGMHYAQTPVREFFAEEDIHNNFRSEPGHSGEKTIRGYQVEYTLTLLTSQGNMEGLVLEFRDVTTEKQLREQIARKDKMEALGNLVAGIAHEIRTPLTSIKTFAELLPQKYDNPAFRAKIGQYVPQEVDRIDAMVNSLLDYARPRKPFAERIAVQALLQKILVLFSGYIKKTHIKIKMQVNPECIICCDAQQLQQVLINVLLNAVEALDKQQHPLISIGCRQDQQCTTLVVQDNGCGMQESVKNKIFDPFYTTKPTGTGLGLAISYQFVIENNGKIWVESCPGAGTKVFIQLPNDGSGGCHV